MQQVNYYHFNPRSREGSDSIHSGLRSVLRNFNPRSREGSDVYHLIYIFPNAYFNPRSREGSDRTYGIRKPGTHDFNPRSREGSDEGSYEYRKRRQNFNPRSREGSDCKNTQTTNIISVYFYLYYIIFVSLATNTAYITITKPSKCRCESPYTFC